MRSVTIILCGLKVKFLRKFRGYPANKILAAHMAACGISELMGLICVNTTVSFFFGVKMGIQTYDFSFIKIVKDLRFSERWLGRILSSGT
jgi:hypothetical protein